MITIIDWLGNVIQGFIFAGQWLITPVVGSWSPLAILSFSGLMFVLGVWVVKFFLPS